MCAFLLQASTLDGVLELKKEHFWTIAFGHYVSDKWPMPREWTSNWSSASISEVSPPLPPGRISACPSEEGR